MITVLVHDGKTVRRADRIEPQWLDADAGVTLWVDLASPTPEELELLAAVFHFHPVAVEGARSATQYPKIEAYPGFLYVILHGIDVREGKHRVVTRDVDFFVTRNALVTVHDGRSTSIAALIGLCDRTDRVLSEGPVGLLHRIIDQMVSHYWPPMEELERRIDALEESAFTGHEHMARRIMRVKRELAVARRILVLQRDVIGRLARREFSSVSDEMAFRFRDTYDHIVRLTEEAILFQDRITGVFEVNLGSVSNRLNQVMKVLTVMSTIFLPLTVLTSMWGMNILLPHFPGGDAAQFWWILGVMVALAAGMLTLFRRNRWI
jgi:magnesium transporter